MMEGSALQLPRKTPAPAQKRVMEYRAQSTGVESKARVSKRRSECRTTKAARGTTRGKTKGKYLNSPPYI